MCWVESDVLKLTYEWPTTYTLDPAESFIMSSHCNRTTCGLEWEAVHNGPGKFGIRRTRDHYVNQVRATGPRKVPKLSSFENFRQIE